MDSVVFRAVHPQTKFVPPSGRRKFFGGRFICLPDSLNSITFPPMKFFAAILVFALFAFFISWGVVEMLQGRPWLLLAAVGVFLGAFIKFGCLSH